MSKPKRFSYERQLAEQYVAAHLAYMGADPGTPEFDPARDEYLSLAKRLAHVAVAVLLGEKAADAANVAADAASEASHARYIARVAAREAAAAPLAPPVDPPKPTCPTCGGSKLAGLYVGAGPGCTCPRVRAAP